MTTFDVSSIGFYVLDILGRPVSAIPPGGRAFFIDEITMTVAGTAGATAMACAILGLRTRAVGSVGDDEMGEIMLNSLGRKGYLEGVTALKRLDTPKMSSGRFVFSPRTCLAL